MKKISILSFLAATLFMVSCQDPETPDLGASEQWLQFGQSEYAWAENEPEPLTVKVHYAADENPNDITVEYTVTAEDPARFEMEPVTGTVVIPAGEFSADIVIDPVDNFQVDGDTEVILALTTHPEIPLGLGGDAVNAHEAIITIIDDDCPVDIESFVGTWSVAEQFTAGVNAPNGLVDFFGESYQVEISLAPGDATGTQLVLNNSEGYNEYFVPGTVITLRTCTETFDFNAGNPVLAAFATLAPVPGQPGLVTSFDAEAMRISASGYLGTYGQYQFLLTKISE